MSGERPPWTQSTSPSMIFPCVINKNYSRAKLDANGDERAHRSKIKVIEDTTARFPNGGAAVLLLTLLSMRCRIVE